LVFRKLTAHRFRTLPDGFPETCSRRHIYRIRRVRSRKSKLSGEVGPEPDDVEIVAYDIGKDQADHMGG